MNKIQVLKSEPCMRPDREEFGLSGIMLAKAQIIRADNKDVLNIDLFRRDELVRAGSTLEARYFAEKDTGTFKAVVRTSTGKREWRRLTIDNVAMMVRNGYVNPGGQYWWRPRAGWEYASEQDKKTVVQYLGGGIGLWENEINSNRYYSSQNRKQNRITMMMAGTVPALPDGFDAWIHKAVFPREYVFITRPKKEGGMYRYYCTSCGGGWRSRKPGKIGYMACRRCGERVLASRNEGEVSAEEQVFLLQPCMGNAGQWIERAFKVRAKWNRDKPGKLVKRDEQIRIIIPDGHQWGVCYYESGVAHDGGGLYWDRNTHSRRMKAGYLYPGTREEVEKCWSNALRHSGIWELSGMGKVNVNDVIIHADYRPYMEYLLKGKFFRIAVEIAKGTGKGYSLHDGSSPGEVFGLSNDRVDRLRRMDGGFTVLSWLRQEEKSGKKITQENLEWADTHGISAEESRIRSMMDRMGSANVLLNYLRKQCDAAKKAPNDVIGTYQDYIQMAKRQGLNIAHAIFYKPKDLYAAHDACVREGQKKQSMKRAQEILKKFPKVEEVLEKIRPKYTYDGEKYSIIVPEDIQDIIHEGRALGHCIDTTDRYFDRIGQGISYLVFLRRKEMKEIPWYTLEIEPGGTIRQQRTTGNQQNKEDAKAYMPFIREWQKVVRERISEEDRKLAEKSRQTRILEYAQLREKKEKVWRGKLAGKLLADVLEADLVECL